MKAMLSELRMNGRGETSRISRLFRHPRDADKFAFDRFNKLLQ